MEGWQDRLAIESASSARVPRRICMATLSARGNGDHALAVHGAVDRERRLTAQVGDLDIRGADHGVDRDPGAEDRRRSAGTMGLEFDDQLPHLAAWRAGK